MHAHIWNAKTQEMREQVESLCTANVRTYTANTVPVVGIWQRDKCIDTCVYMYIGHIHMHGMHKFYKCLFATKVINDHPESAVQYCHYCHV